MERLRDVLMGREGNSIMPFFWQHGETQGTLEEYMERIRECGCGGVCVEARPHPEFGKDRWWEDVGFIVDKAKKDGMEVWILDDSHFPTGFANGLVKEKYPQFLKTYLDLRRFDVAGPLGFGRMNLRFLKGRPWDAKGREKDVILGVYGARREDEPVKGFGDRVDPVRAETLVDLTGMVKDGILYWDIPEGNWSVLVVFETRLGGEESTKDYLNPLVKEAAEVLIEAVYQPHYEHFKEFFGTTITAFFSDEPRFGNVKGTEGKMGRADMVLPWCEGLDEILPFGKEFLPFLFVDSADDTMSRVRFAYMDCVSRLYSENFTQVLGKWCRDHGVKYVGHHIEDNGAHARLGYGPGHLFRAQKGQDFSGIDVISNQIAPGYDFHHDAFAAGGNDGVFYHYGLGRLGASVAQNDPEKNGIAMCEAFGAYGWNEGLKWMKWITDHLLARGINYFVPHAFDPKEYPDWDCPPHFYAHGNNPQFRYFPVLMRYMQRMCHLLQGGVHEAAVAVLYPAEGEWCGDILPVERVLRELDHSQIGAAVVCLDDLTDEQVEDGAFLVNQNRYECLIVPAMERIPKVMLRKLLMLCEAGVSVVFADGEPWEVLLERSISCEERQTEEIPEYEMFGKLLGMTENVSLEKISGACEKWRTVWTSEKQKGLVSYHYVQPDGEIFLLFNENPAKSIETELTIASGRTPVVYDAFANRLRAVSVRRRKQGRMEMDLCLKPYESVVILACDSWDGFSVEEEWTGTVQRTLPLVGTWKVSFADAKSYGKGTEASGFVEVGRREELLPLSCEPEFADKTGTLRYEKTFDWEKSQKSRVFLSLGEVFETAEVFVNGKSAGVCICPPYRIEITEELAFGRNELAVEVTNTLGNENKDFMSQYTPIEPFGLLGPVILEEETI